MVKTQRQRRKLAALLVVALVASGVGVLAYALHLLRPTELQTIDARFSIRGRRSPPSNIVFVAISEQAEQELMQHNLDARSPLPRKYDAQVVERLRRGGAKVIAMDLVFTTETNPSEDNELIEAVDRAHGKVVLAANIVLRGGGTQVFGGEPLLREIGARPGDVKLTLDSDGSVRRFSRETEGLTSFPVVATEVMTGKTVAASSFEDGTLPIDYAGPARTFHSISYAKVLMGEFPPGMFENKLVIVGASSPILQDLHATSTSGSEPMPGPEIWANAAATLLQGIPLRDASDWLSILLIVVIGVAVPLGSLRLRRWRSMLDAVALAVTFTVATQIAFNSGLIVPVVYPLLALVLGTLGTLVVLYMSETVERERVRDVFSRFVPTGVVDEVLASADENFRLGGVERDCTVMFCDLRGFTTFSETQPAPRVIEVVNHYLNEMTEAILAAGGTLIAYLGDGILAVFGVPLEQDDHADRAVVAAREMIGTRLDRFNAWLAEQGFDHGFKVGVGLHSGTVMAGNVGSEQRLEYTVIGDTANTASRLEGMTKGSDTMLFISDATRERMRGSTEELAAVGEVEIRGRANKLGVWTIRAPGARAPDGGDGAEQSPAAASLGDSRDVAPEPR
jgi:adenylate cyclase